MDMESVRMFHSTLNEAFLPSHRSAYQVFPDTRTFHFFSRI